MVGILTGWSEKASVENHKYSWGKIVPLVDGGIASERLR